MMLWFYIVEVESFKNIFNSEFKFSAIFIRETNVCTKVCISICFSLIDMETNLYG
jgi:hypothetical protein